MKLCLIRHGQTEANEKQLHCGQTDVSVTKQGILDLFKLKESIVYPTAAIYITSGLIRTRETLWTLYDKEPDIIISEFMEMDLGDFEMKSYDDLKDNPEYQRWIEDIENAACPNGESKILFINRINKGLDKLKNLNTKSAVVICHGGVISLIMDQYFPGKQNFYEWQPSYGRGYTLELTHHSAVMISNI